MRVLVCGGRDYRDVVRAFYVLDEYHKKHGITVLIEGGAQGADRLGRQWALGKGLPVITMEANWSFYGKSAGPVRNEWMMQLALPDVIIAFPGGSGTADMVKRGKKEVGVEVYEIDK